MNLENYLIQRFRIASLTIEKWQAEVVVKAPGSNVDGKKALKNIYLKLAISHGLIGNQKKANKLEALAQQYI